MEFTSRRGRVRRAPARRGARRGRAWHPARGDTAPTGRASSAIGEARSQPRCGGAARQVGGSSRGLPRHHGQHDFRQRTTEALKGGIFSGPRDAAIETLSVLTRLVPATGRAGRVDRMTKTPSQSRLCRRCVSTVFAWHETTQFRGAVPAGENGPESGWRHGYEPRWAARTTVDQRGPRPRNTGPSSAPRPCP